MQLLPVIPLLPAIVPAVQLLPVMQLLSVIISLLPIILPVIAVPGFLLLFLLDCTCGDVARGG